MGKKVGWFTLFKRAIIVSLFSFSLASLIVESGYGFVFRENIDPNIALNLAEASFLGTFFFTGYMVIIFIPVWLLKDTGIVVYRFREERSSPPDIESIASLFLKILEGYAGISAVLFLITTISNCFIEILTIVPMDPQAIAGILTPIILIFLPFIVTGLLTFPLIIYELSLSSIRKKFHSTLEEKGVPCITFPEFGDLKIREDPNRTVD